MTRVILADDDFLLREGLASMLERAGFEVVAVGRTGTRAYNYEAASGACRLRWSVPLR